MENTCTCTGLDLQNQSAKNLEEDKIIAFLKPSVVYVFLTALGLHCFRSCYVQCLVIQVPLEFEIERDCAFLLEVMLKNHSCPHRLRPVIA